MGDRGADSNRAKFTLTCGMADKRIVATGVIGAIVAALCCATPVLLPVIAALGLSAAAGYLDFVLLTAILVFVAVAIYGLTRRRA